jgi:two-component system chemotaxis sensor kinase CheA
MLELYLFEATTLLESLDGILLQAESEKKIAKENIHEAFRILHTIKGSSAMMSFHTIQETAHRTEDLFSYIRDNGIDDAFLGEVLDLALAAMNFLEGEVQKVQEGLPLTEGNPQMLERIADLLDRLAQGPEAAVRQRTAPAPLPDEAQMPVAPEGGRILGIEYAPHVEGKSGIGEVEEVIDADFYGIDSDYSEIHFADEAYEPDGGVMTAPDIHPFGIEAGSDAPPDVSRVYYLHIHFNEGAKMENLRAYMLANKLSEMGTVEQCIPSDLENNPEAAAEIIENGFYAAFRTTMFREQIERVAKGTLSVESVSFVRRMPDTAAHTAWQNSMPKSDRRKPMPQQQRPRMMEAPQSEPVPLPITPQLWQPSHAPSTQAQTAETQQESVQVTEHPVQQPAPGAHELQQEPQDTLEPEPLPQQGGRAAKQNLISVDLTKLDSLLDLVGEIVINESMVTENPDLEGLPLDNFNKAARQLGKLTDELQDTVMAVRMVPVSSLFQRMARVVRDLGKQLGKNVELVLFGEHTEVDKTILDALSDPLLHLVRNAMDHAIETREERSSAGKGLIGHIALSAQNVGGDVIISVSDDGRGLDAATILEKARERGLLKKPESEYTEREAYNILLVPGFTTRDCVTEVSGRGVGLDVVRQNIEGIGGSIYIESVKDVGTNVLLKIPLTLAIISCMQLRLGRDVFSIPITNIRESFKMSTGQFLSDPAGNEMIMLRGKAYPIIRLHEILGVPNAVRDIGEGILILVDTGDRLGCLLADELIGKSQVVVKPIPVYLKQFGVKRAGISGCSIMGNGEISLVLDVQELCQ